MNAVTNELCASLDFITHLSDNTEGIKHGAFVPQQEPDVHTPKYMDAPRRMPVVKLLAGDGGVLRGESLLMDCAAF